MASSKGKFISAFGSMQMLGENYDFPNDDDDDHSNENAENSLSGDNRTNFLPNKQDVHSTIATDSINPLSINGEELYNPLECVESDDENDMIISNSPNSDEKKTKFSKKPIDISKPVDIHLTINNEMDDETSRDMLSGNVIADEETLKQEENIIKELEETAKHPENKKLFDEQDELLGTALAELEEEEKNTQSDLDRIIAEAKSENKEFNVNKKNKNKTDHRRDEKEEKEEKKKKKKKKRKKKARESDGKKKKKSKRRKDDLEGLGIDELLQRIKEEEQKMENRKQEKKRDKRKDSKVFRNRSVSPKKKVERDSKSCDAKNERRRSHRTPSPIKKSQYKSSSSPDRRGKHSSSDTKRDSYKKSVSKEKQRYRSVSPRRDSRSKTSRESSQSYNKHRENGSKSPERSDRKNHKVCKKRSHTQSPEDEEVRTKKPTSNHDHRNETRKIDYEVKMAERTSKEKKDLSPLSKEEFYKLQNQVRKSDSKVDNSLLIHKQTSSILSRSSSSGSEEQPTKVKKTPDVDKALHRSTFTDNYSVELDKIRKEHKIDVEMTTKHSPTKPRRSSPSRRKSYSPKLDEHTYEDLHFDAKRRSVSENNESKFSNNIHATNYIDVFENTENLSINISKSENTQEFRKSLYKPVSESKPANLKDIEAISSQSEAEDFVEIVEDKPQKVGSLSLRQYKERRAATNNRERKTSDHKNRESSTIHGPSNSSVSSLSDSLHNQSSKENEVCSRPYHYQYRHAAKDHEIDMTVERRDKNAIPLLNEKVDKHLSRSAFDAEAESIFQSKDDQSPYNPEAASPFDLASPSDAAIEDRSDVNFDSYKDVTAFEDIMKSKVKHEARKHQRRKLEEIKAKLGSPKAGSKEGKLVDYLVRQSQVEEEMKSVLKTFFKNHEITKEEYKSILKKAVPQVTMSNSPIVAEKIQSLMTKFVRKCKGQRAAEERKRRQEQQELTQQQKQLQQQLQSSAAIFQQIRVLNPNLPMPPV